VKVVKLKKFKRVHGFQTGDMVRAVVTHGKKAGTYSGRVLVRTSGSFDIRTATQRIQGLNYKYFTHQHRSDGYAYSFVSATD
jgi:hypothetical protein